MDSDAEHQEEGIPRILWSAYEERPFSTCVDCGASLLDSEIPHAVEKTIRQGEVIFEYAICMSCILGLMQEYSEESIANIQSYLQEEELGFEPAGDGSSCQHCGASGPKFLEEHTVTGMILGEGVLAGPTTLCGRCLEGIDDVLSQKTREVHEDFIRNNFPGVPESLDIPVSFLGSA